MSALEFNGEPRAAPGWPPMSAAHIIASLDPIHGGPSYSVPRLCRALEDEGVDVKLYTLLRPGENPPGADNVDEVFAPDWSAVPVLRQMCRSSALNRRLREIAPTIGLVHNHGLWLAPNVDSGHIACMARKPFVVSPRGMLGLEALAFSRTKKRVVWSLLQGGVVRHAACIHATSEQECAEVRAFGLDNPVAVVPNGIDVPAAVPTVPAGRPSRTVMTLGRLHPKKGLDRLIRAWRALEPRHPKWSLRIIGQDEGGYGAELKALVSNLNVQRVSVEPPIYGDAKWSAYREAAVFVLPTLNENFASTVAEALASGTPAVVSKGAPWKGVEVHGCGWWVDQGIEPLAAALEEAMALPAERLRGMGLRGRAWMVRDFSWARVGRDMADVYAWLLRRADRPATVQLA